MSREVGEIVYNSEAKLVATRTDETPKPKIEIIIQENESKQDSVELEMRFIAKQIKALVETKKYTYKDIGILLRSISSRSKKILSIFSEEGIPVLFDDDKEQVNTIEISLFLKLLNLIDNHKQDIPLLSIMHLPIFGFSLDDEAEIRLKYDKEPYFYQSVEKYMNEEDNELSERLSVFYNLLDDWRELSKHFEIDEFLWKVLLDSGFYNYFGNLSNGNERKRNLRILLDKAKSYKDTSLKGITSFLHYVSKLEKNGQVLNISSSNAESTDAVRLMTIHKSKGLEFPVVFVADLNRHFNKQLNDPFIYNKNFGFSSKSYELNEGVLINYNNILNNSLRYLHEKELLSEEMRLLYVALTRAKDELYLVGTIKEKDLERKKSEWEKEASPYHLLHFSSLLDWVMTAVYNNKSLKIVNSTNLETNEWILNFINWEDLLNQDYIIDNSFIEEDAEYEKLKTLVFDKLSSPIEPVENNKPLKMSVSRIKRNSIKEEEPIELVPLESLNSSFTAAEIGTGIHKILQKIDFTELENSSNYEAYLNNLVEELTEINYLDPQLLEEIDLKIITRFLNSEIGQRAIKSSSLDPDNILKEVPFLYDIDMTEVLNEEENLRPIEVTGIIDICFLEDNNWILLDYKTDHLYSQKQWDQRIEEYTVQIELYAKALEELTNISVKEKHLIFLNEDRDIKIS